MSFRTPSSRFSSTRLRTAAGAFLLALGIVVAVQVTRAAGSMRWPWSATPPKVTHEMVVVQLRDVAKLVSTELTLRDVVTYEQSRLGMKRRALLVVTGKVHAGINLQRGTDVQIDDEAKRITITMPRAEILAVEIIDSRTYDESGGLFFNFQPSDRDAIQRQTRHQLRAAGEQSGLLPRADESARALLRGLLARDGYSVEVKTRTELARPSG